MSPWACRLWQSHRTTRRAHRLLGLCRGPLFSPWQPQGSVCLLGYKDTSHDSEGLRGGNPALEISFFPVLGMESGSWACEASALPLSCTPLPGNFLGAWFNHTWSRQTKLCIPPSASRALYRGAWRCQCLRGGTAEPQQPGRPPRKAGGSGHTLPAACLTCHGRTWPQGTVTCSWVPGCTSRQFLPKGLKNSGRRVGISHRESARPFSCSEKPHLLQGNHLIENRQNVFDSINKTEQYFWTHQKYFL